jgi:hypothetical protein
MVFRNHVGVAAILREAARTRENPAEVSFNKEQAYIFPTFLLF